MFMMEMRKPNGFWSEDLVGVEEVDQTPTSCSVNKQPGMAAYVLLSL